MLLNVPPSENVHKLQFRQSDKKPTVSDALNLPLHSSHHGIRAEGIEVCTSHLGGTTCHYVHKTHTRLKFEPEHTGRWQHCFSQEKEAKCNALRLKRTKKV